MEDLEPPTDYFSSAPADIIRSLNLDYEDVLNLCSINVKFNKICKDPKFWKMKIQRDFKDEIIPNIEKLDYRKYYELLLAIRYNDKLIEIESEKWNDPNISELRNELREVAFEHETNRRGVRPLDLANSVIDSIAGETKIGKEYLSRKSKLEEPYDDKINALKRKLKILRKRYDPIIQSLEEYKYIPLEVTDSIFPWNSLYRYSGLRKYLRSKGYMDPILPGNLFKFINRNDPTSPSIFVYVTRRSNSYEVFNIPDGRIRDINNIKFKDLPSEVRFILNNNENAYPGLNVKPSF